MATNNFKLISSDSVSAIANTLINTAPTSATMVIHSIYLTNVGSGESFANVLVEDVSATTTTHVAYNSSIPAGETLIFDKPLNLETGDKLYVRGTDLEVTVSALEIS